MTHYYRISGANGKAVYSRRLVRIDGTLDEIISVLRALKAQGFTVEACSMRVLWQSTSA